MQKLTCILSLSSLSLVYSGTLSLLLYFHLPAYDLNCFKTEIGTVATHTYIISQQSLSPSHPIPAGHSLLLLLQYWNTLEEDDESHIIMGKLLFNEEMHHRAKMIHRVLEGLRARRVCALTPSFSLITHKQKQRAEKTR